MKDAVPRPLKEVLWIVPLLALLLYALPPHCGVRQPLEGNVVEADTWNTFQKNCCNCMSVVACVKKPVRIRTGMY
jgi:hypothetical protein